MKIAINIDDQLYQYFKEDYNYYKAGIKNGANEVDAMTSYYVDRCCTGDIHEGDLLDDLIKEIIKAFIGKNKEES